VPDRHKHKTQSTALNHLHRITSVPEAKLSIKIDLYWAGPENFMPVVKELASSAVWSFMFNLKYPVIQTGLSYHQSFTGKKNKNKKTCHCSCPWAQWLFSGPFWWENVRSKELDLSSSHHHTKSHLIMYIYSAMLSLLWWGQCCHGYPMFICCGFWMLFP